MITRILEKLHKLDGVTFRDGLVPDALSRFENSCGWRLPTLHRTLLLTSNGIDTFFGFFRLYGISGTANVAMEAWNDTQCWKFAWGHLCDSFWCFGGSAWGEQYAYEVTELAKMEDPPVYLLDGLSMNATILESSFGHFVLGEQLRNAQQPYDAMTVTAFKTIGPLEPNRNVVYSPSLLIGGTENIEHVVQMDSACAMICNGDMAMQMNAAQSDWILEGCETYSDDRGRLRVRLLWSTQGP